MRKFLMSLACVISVASVTQAAEISTVTLLDRGEPHEGMVFHDQHLFVGKSRTDFNSDYRVEIYNSSQQLVSTIKLGHSATYIHAYNDHSVLVLGTAFAPKNQTVYTVIENRGGKFTAKANPIAVTAWAYRWLGTVDGREYFADPGGNGQDNNQDPKLPAQTIFSLLRGTPRYLPVRMRLPIAGVTSGSKLFVVQRESMGFGESNVGIIDTASNQLTYAFPEFRNGLKDIVKVERGDVLAVSESGTDSVLFLNRSSGQLAGSVRTDASPTSLATYGKCVIVGSESERTIQAVDVSNPAAPQVSASVRLDLPENEFKWLAKIVVDGLSGVIYARSHFACNPIAEECNDDWNRVVAIKTSILGGC